MNSASSVANGTASAEPQKFGAGQTLLWKSAAGIPIVFRRSPAIDGAISHDPQALRMHLDHARLGLLRGFDQLLCLDGLHNIEHLEHQVETVRKVLRRFRGRVLLADEVGLGKTIEACLLLREYLLRGLVKRVLILVPSPLVSQWQEELHSKFNLDFTVPPRTSTSNQAEYWSETDRLLVSMSYAKSAKRFDAVTAAPWDLVIVDEAHHCKNHRTLNWQLVNQLKRRHLFLLTATPVQNNLLELYNLLTLLEPGHLKTESDFKRHYVRRGNPRDPLNRERLRTLLGEVMVRNTRSMVHMDLPPRYAQTLVAEPQGAEAQLYQELETYLRQRKAPLDNDAGPSQPKDAAQPKGRMQPASEITLAASELPPLSRMQFNTLLSTVGSHPGALARSLEKIAADDASVKPLIELADSVERSAKDTKLLELIRQSHGNKMLVFANYRRTIARLQELLAGEGIAFSTFSGDETPAQKDAAVQSLREEVGVMLCSESGGEGRNLQFANTLVNYDLPWNPMKIEQRVGRIHRIGQTREVFVFNLCTAGSLEERILDILNDKIRMFELIVGEVGSILGNLDGGEEFESLVLNLWIKSRDSGELAESFDHLGSQLLESHEAYLETKKLDEALFGDDYE